MNQHPENIIFLKFSQVRISACHRFRILHSWIELLPNLLTIFETVIGDLQGHLQETKASIIVWWVTNSPDHQHAIILVDGTEVATEVPRSTKDLILNELGYLLFQDISLLWAIFIWGITNFVSICYIFNTAHSQHGLSVESTFISADHFWSDEIFDGLVTQLLGRGAYLISVNFNLDFFYELFQHLIR